MTCILIIVGSRLPLQMRGSQHYWSRQAPRPKGANDPTKPVYSRPPKSEAYQILPQPLPNLFRNNPSINTVSPNLTTFHNV